MKCSHPILIMVLLGGLFLLPAATQAQKKKKTIAPEAVPGAVHTRFQALYPGQPVETWKVKDERYEANFKLNERKVEVDFASNGEWLKTAERIDATQLPPDAQTYIGNNHSMYKLKKAEKHTTPKKTTYRVVMKSGESVVKLRFSKTGELIKSS